MLVHVGVKGILGVEHLVAYKTFDEGRLFGWEGFVSSKGFFGIGGGGFDTHNEIDCYSFEIKCKKYNSKFL